MSMAELFSGDSANPTLILRLDLLLLLHQGKSKWKEDPARSFVLALLAFS
jgi:hypothetical protein